MLSDTVPAMRCACCGTNVTFRAHSALERSRTSRPSASTAPLVGSRRASSSCTSVDLPLPDGPTMPTISRCSIDRLTECRTGASAVYSKVASASESDPTAPTGAPRLYESGALEAVDLIVEGLQEWDS